MIAKAQSKSVPARPTIFPSLPHTCFLPAHNNWVFECFEKNNYMIWLPGYISCSPIHGQQNVKLDNYNYEKHIFKTNN